MLVYSMWEGYIGDNSELKQLRRDLGPKFVKLHSSGHASKELVKYVINSNLDAHIIPMHTESFKPWDEICEDSHRLVKLHKGDYYTV